jgi:hypothetical protein
MPPRYELAMASRPWAGDPAGMKKRALAAVLWFYSTWYAGAMVAHMLGLSEALGPILGTAAAAIIAGDPRGVIWTRAPRTRSAPMAPAIQNPA